MTNQNPYQSLFQKHKERLLIQRVEPLHLRIDRLKKLENWLLTHRKAIAEALVVSLPTVKTHISRILDKLRVEARNAAAARARDLRLI